MEKIDRIVFNSRFLQIIISIYLIKVKWDFMQKDFIKLMKRS